MKRTRDVVAGGEADALRTSTKRVALVVHRPARAACGSIPFVFRSVCAFGAGPDQDVSGLVVDARWSIDSFTMTVSFDIPIFVREALSRHGGDPNAAAREATLVELYRRGVITHHELGQALGLDRFATEARLKTLGVFEGAPTLDDIETDRCTLDRILGPVR